MAKLPRKTQKVIKCFLVALAWQMVVLAVALLSQAVRQQKPTLDYLMIWDGDWHASIINGSYDDSTSPASLFYPLLPLIVFLIKSITSGIAPLSVTTIIVNIISLGFAVFFLHEIALILFKKTKIANLAVTLFLVFPTAFFMGQFYTEALFCALSFGAYYLALNKKWLGTGVVLAFLTSVRLPSILIILLCSIEFLHQNQWSIKKAFNKDFVWLLLAPLSFLAYEFYLLHVRRVFFGMFGAYSLTNSWVYREFNPLFFQTIAREVRIVLTNFFVDNHLNLSDYLINHTIPLLSLGLLTASSIYIMKKHGTKTYALGITGFATVIFFTLNNNIVSAHRYVLTNFVIFLAGAIFINSEIKAEWRKPIFITILLIGIVSQIVLLSLFVSNKFVG